MATANNLELRKLGLRALGGLAAFIGVGSGLLAFFDAFSVRTVVLVFLALLAVAGWVATLLVVRSKGDSEGKLDPILSAISDRVPIPYLVGWLSSTLLDPRILALYKDLDTNIRVNELRCSTDVQAHDIRIEYNLKARNEGRSAAEGVPLVLFGGSVIHVQDLPLNEAFLIDAGTKEQVALRLLADLPQLELFEARFPTALPPGKDFELLHIQEWPGAMTDGEDSIWYPYALMFRRGVARLIAEVTFDRPVRYIRGYEANLITEQCHLTETQPQATEAARLSFSWTLSTVDRESVYFLVFERARATQ